MAKAARVRAWGDGRHAASIRELPCAIGGQFCDAEVHAHHVRSVGAGGSECDLVPLCAIHHQELHNVGKSTFLRKYGVDLEKLARRLWSSRGLPAWWMKEEVEEQAHRTMA